MGNIKTSLGKTIQSWSIPRHSAVINNEIFGANNDSDISEHLTTLYGICLAKMPSSILELGTRGGESTRVLAAFCEKFQRVGKSIDLVSQPEWLSTKKWKHFAGDDITIGKVLTIEKRWPDGEIFDSLDLIFLDSSHEYEHTLEELKIYWPLISSEGVLILHDTNLTEKITRKLSGNANTGWNNEEGVSRAIQDYFGISLQWNELQSLNGKNEKNQFRGLVHFPWNNGLTCIYK
jgi:predicted O-methyltransferase YrrM